MNRETAEQVNNNLLKIEELMEKNEILKMIGDELIGGSTWKTIARRLGFVKTDRLNAGLKYMTRDEILGSLDI
jgi:hypothetical protein